MSIKPIIMFAFSVFLKYFNTTEPGCRDSVIGIATTLRTGPFGVQTAVGAKRFSVHHTHQDWSCDPPSLLYNGYRGSFPKVKRPRRGVDHPCQSSTEGGNGYGYARMASHRENVTFTVELTYITSEIVQVGEDSYVVSWFRHRTVRYVGITVLNEHAASFSTVELTSKLF